MIIAIRQIQPDDAVPLADFYNALSEPSKRTFRPLGLSTTADVCGTIIEENAPAIARKLDLVACREDRIVGWVFLWGLQSEAPTFGLSVADDCQGQGLGSALMDRAIECALERGIHSVTLTVVQDNDKARGMYERRGFVKQEAFIGEDGLPYFSMSARVIDARP